MALNDVAGVLEGLCVTEVSAFVAAPSGGMTLAQLGAEVIRIDRPGGGLDYRRWPVTENNMSLFWAGLNKGKKSVTIDVAQPEGRELAQALITRDGADAGMLLTNMPPRGWLDYEALKVKRADLIQLTIQGDRHGGAAVDYTVNPRMGLPSITGPVDTDGVVNHVLPAWDLVCGQMAAVGLLAAERHRSRTGAGRHIKLALEDVALAAMANLGFIAEAERGVDRARYGNDLFGAFGRDFGTVNGERIMVVALTGKQWQALVKAIGAEKAIAVLEQELGADLTREGERFQHRERIAAVVADWTESRTLSVVAEAFTAHGVCWSRYQSVRELVQNDPACSEENPMFARIQQPGIGATLAPAVPLDFGEMREAARPAPELGVDTEAVLVDYLGLSAGEFGALRDRGVV